MEELISRPFVSEIQFRLVLQKRMGTESAIGCLFFIHQVLLFCPTHARIIRSSMGVSGRICSEAGRMDFSANNLTTVHLHGFSNGQVCLNNSSTADLYRFCKDYSQLCLKILKGPAMPALVRARMQYTNFLNRRTGRKVIT